MPDQTILGKKGAAEVVTIFAATTNSDREEGRGTKIDHSYYQTERGAKLGSVGIGVFGTDGGVEPRVAIRFEDGQLFLLNQDSPTIVLGNEELLAQDVRKAALSKLTPAERQALGLD